MTRDPHRNPDRAARCALLRAAFARLRVGRGGRGLVLRRVAQRVVVLPKLGRPNGLDPIPVRADLMPPPTRDLARLGLGLAGGGGGGPGADRMGAAIA